MKNKPEVTRFECVRPDWVRVVNAARRTWGKAPIDHEPSDTFKRKILLAEHTPIRLLEYDFTIENIRQWVTVHLVRHHVGCEKFVSSQREDINARIEEMTRRIVEVCEAEGLLRDGWKARDYMMQGEPNAMDMACNAQAFINISRKRLCKGCPSPETRLAWEIVIEALSDFDPILAEKCVPECVYRGFCPEHGGCCGYANTEAFRKKLEEYRKI